MRTEPCSTCTRRSGSTARGSATRRMRCPNCGAPGSSSTRGSAPSSVATSISGGSRRTAWISRSDAHGVDDSALREDLLRAYLSLDCYPEVPGILSTLKEAGQQTAILSNGSPMMLEAAVASAGIGDGLDAVISVDGVGLYKPAPEVYQLAMDALQVGRGQISFQSSNAWDAAAAATFGFRVAWCNRFGQARERLPDAPDAEISNARRAAGHRAVP